VPLNEYKRKRNFSESPEPSGDHSHESPAGRTPRFFCVQKHLASHLHYDFRLEHNGVLLSWAVPKGPSLDPATKRLAMQVEDHPIEYGEFEGVIPSGYGAGIVMLWDRGTWTPEVDDVDAALRKGDLKITLHGFKLKGSWVLVRTRGWGGGSSGGSARSWLLIKHRDEWSGNVDITEFAPASVKSGGDFADILAEGRPEIWQSHRPAQSGEAGQMFERIVRRALEMRSGADGLAAGKAPAPKPRRSSAPAQPASRASTARSRATTAAAKTSSPRSRRAASPSSPQARAARPKTAATKTAVSSRRAGKKKK
jgi:bifunctional non-homologous end joining protein LigD